MSELSDLEDVTLEVDHYRRPHLPGAPAETLVSRHQAGWNPGFQGNRGKKESIKYLELWQVRDLRDINVVGTLPGLQNLFLQSLPHVGSFPQLRESAALRRVVIENLKGLSDFTALAGAPALEEFLLLQGNRQTPRQLVPVLSNPNVRRVGAYFGSNRKNSEFSDLREEHGKAELKQGEPFEYFERED